MIWHPSGNCTINHAKAETQSLQYPGSGDRTFLDKLFLSIGGFGAITIGGGLIGIGVGTDLLLRNKV